MACIKASSVNGSADNINKVHQNKKSINEIYTDWANHYLEKGRSKRHISDLQVDVTDGVILADVIEAVTGQKVPDINKKPKNSTQMLENLNSSLTFLASLGVQLDSLTPKDIKDGNLKSILSLFFALSRYKQQQKQALQERRELEKLREKKQESEVAAVPQSRLGSSPYKGQAVGGGSSIPTPALGGRRPPADHHSKGLPRSTTPSASPAGSQLKGAPSTSSSRSTSPANGSASFIPTPRGHGGSRSSANEKHKSGGSTGVNRSLRASSGVGSHSISANNNQYGHGTKNKDSMLDKFKLFNNKDKETKSKTSSSSGVSKRTSSSSGFSSARSERSDSSSASICSEARPPPLPPHQSLPGSTTSSSSSEQAPTPIPAVEQSPQSGKSPGLRGIRSRFTRAGKEGKESAARSSRRSEEREGSKGSPRSTHRIHRSGDSRDREKEKERDKESRVESKVHEGRGTERLTLDLDKNSRCISPLTTDLPKTSKITALATSRQHAFKEQNAPLKSPTMPQQSSAPSTPVSPLSSASTGSTGIPKPTAAVKGTTKPPSECTSPSSPNVNLPTAAKDYHNKMVRTSPAPNQRRNIHIDSPASHDGRESREQRDPKGSLPRQRNLGRREDSVPPSVAMVSPMPVANHNNNISSNANNNQVSGSESGSTLSEASHNSGHSNSNSSGGSSVIYRPTSSEEDNSMEKMIQKEMEDKLIRNEDGDEVILDIKPMQPLVRAAQYGYMRGMSSPIQHTRAVPPSLHVSRLALQDASHTVPQKGMRFAPPHLRRQISNGSPRMNMAHIDGDYSEIEGIDLSNGYMSDGDVLRQNIDCRTYPGPDLDGYLSEGGASLYAHRLNQRFKEGIRQVHESMNKVQHFMHDDSFDDSSSLSSGVSDTLNELSEDLLSSSLSSEHTVAIAKARGLKDVGLKLPIGLSGSSPRKGAIGMDPSGAYKVVSSRAQVRKTDNSKTNENPCFKQISNTQWKKFVDGGKPAYDGKEYIRLSDLNGSVSSKKQEQKRGLGSPLIPNNLGGFIGHPASVSQITSGSKRHDKRSSNTDRRDHKAIPLSPQINGDAKKIQNLKSGGGSFGYNGKKAPGVTSGNIKNGSKSKQENDSSGANGSSHSLDRPKTRVKVSGGTQTTSDLQFMPAVGFHSDGEYSSNSLGRKYQQMKSYSLNGPAAAQLSQGVRERILQSPYRKVHVGGTSELAAYAQGYYRERSPRIKSTDGSLSDSPYSNYAEIQYGGSPYGSPYSWVSRGHYATSVASAPTRPHGNSLTEAESLESISSSNSSFAAQLQHARATSLTQARLMMHQREMSTSPSPRLARSNSVRSTKSEKIIGMRDGYHNSQPTSPTPPPSARLPVSPLNAARGSPYYSSVVSRASKDDECHGSSLSLVSSSSSLYSSQEDKHQGEIRKLRRDLTDAQEKVVTLTTQLTTNAHVVAAFEQSLTNMTNRLQQLATTSEQKDSELVELKRTIEALRQQSVDAGLTVACLQSGNLVRGTSVESVSSLSSACSGTSHTSGHEKSDSSKSAKKKGWLRSSFTKAFSRGAKVKKISLDPDDIRIDKMEEYSSLPSSPLPNRGNMDEAKDEDANSSDEKKEDLEILKRQLWEKDMVLTDIRLEALSSAHQLDSLKEKLNKMRSEMKSLKGDNDRLQRLQMSSKSLNSSQSSVSAPEPTDKRVSLVEEIAIEDSADVLLIDPLDKDGKRVSISVLMGCHGDYDKYLNPVDGAYVSECVIGAISLSGRTKWDTLDSLVKRIFKEYLMRVDPVSNLGISSDSVSSYHLGELSRAKDSSMPELLPCGYLVGEVTNVRVVLRGACINCVDALAFETLVPKSIVQRYVSLLSEHRRIILCGPSGTGKTFLAKKLAEFLVCRLGKDPSPGNIATFSVDTNTGKDLGAYLSHISEQCESNASDLPLVIILDNLHHAGALTEVFNGFLSAKYTQCPFIIGTMSQATSCSTTNLQLHHNFRWVLMANHMEPVKGLLAKLSRRKLTFVEVETWSRQPRLQQVLDWLPKCWLHINKFLETYSSSDVTIGPHLFLSCPGSVEKSQIWFSDLWNYSLVPYMVEAVREGLQLYGKRSSWEDPTSWVLDTYPWPVHQHTGAPSLVSLSPEDVGYDTVSNSTVNAQERPAGGQGDNDPLLSMLMRLQEAANFSSPQQDTASVSLENMENALESTL